MPGLPADWKPSTRERIERAWSEHARHAELVELQAERDGDGDPTWQLIRDAIADPEWVSMWFRPVDPLDAREAILVTRWPVSWEEDEKRRALEARAVDEEHAED